MRWRRAMARAVLISGLVMEAGIPGAAQGQGAPGGPAALPAAPADFPLPPHLAGNFPHGVTLGAGSPLPTLQDLTVHYQTVTAPPPTRHRKRQRAGRER